MLAVTQRPASRHLRIDCGPIGAPNALAGKPMRPREICHSDVFLAVRGEGVKGWSITG